MVITASILYMHLMRHPDRQPRCQCLLAKTQPAAQCRGWQPVTFCHGLKLTASNGKQRETDSANTEALLRSIQSIPSPKAEPFKRWLAQVGYERVSNGYHSFSSIYPSQAPRGNPPPPSHKPATPQKTDGCKAWTNRRPAATCAVRGSCPRSCGGYPTKSRSRLGVAARQRDGNDVSLLALKRIDGANAGPALQQMFMQPSKTPCAPQHALPRHWQNVGQFAWMACPCHFRCVPPRFGQQVCLSLKMDLTRYVFKSIIWQ